MKKLNGPRIRELATTTVLSPGTDRLAKDRKTLKNLPRVSQRGTRTVRR